MTSFKRQLIAAVSASTMFFSLATPAFAETTIVISGNGASSTNEADVDLTSDTTVVQTNTANISNDVDADADTGNNDANQNTGGDVLVSTGDATTGVRVENLVNSNKASVDCCPSGDTDVEISGNGAYSENEVELEQDSDISVYQTNDAKVHNDVDADADTGKNDANQNTGGSVSVLTGDAAAFASVSTTANSNWAKIGGDGEGGSLSARILGNGYGSDNDIKLDFDDDTTLVQDNYAYIYNDVDADAKTGKNDANQNTGGDVLIETGDAEAGVEVDNLVNFNWADIDCGCIEDLLAKVAGNGANSENEIELELDNDRTAYQTNDAYLDNDVDADAKTGKNDANQNTGDPGGDPSILTGDSASFVEVNNTGNVNSYGGDWELEWPDWDWELSFSLSLSDLLAFLSS